MRQLVVSLSDTDNSGFKYNNNFCPEQFSDPGSMVCNILLTLQIVIYPADPEYQYSAKFHEYAVLHFGHHTECQ